MGLQIHYDALLKPLQYIIKNIVMVLVRHCNSFPDVSIFYFGSVPIKTGHIQNKIGRVQIKFGRVQFFSYL